MLVVNATTITAILKDDQKTILNATELKISRQVYDANQSEYRYAYSVCNWSGVMINEIPQTEGGDFRI